MTTTAKPKEMNLWLGGTFIWLMLIVSVAGVYVIPSWLAATGWNAMVYIAEIFMWLLFGLYFLFPSKLGSFAALIAGIAFAIGQYYLQVWLFIGGVPPLLNNATQTQLQGLIMLGMVLMLVLVLFGKFKKIEMGSNYATIVGLIAIIVTGLAKAATDLKWGGIYQTWAIWALGYTIVCLGALVAQFYDNKALIGVLFLGTLLASAGAFMAGGTGLSWLPPI